MCKSILYGANTGTQAVTAGSPINFGGTVRRFGRDLNMSGGNVVAYGPGYYEVDANITFVADTAGEVNVAVYRDGIMITGAKASVPGTAGIEYQITIPAVIRNKCCAESEITVIPDVNITLTNAAIVAKKVA